MKLTEEEGLNTWPYMTAITKEFLLPHFTVCFVVVVVVVSSIHLESRNVFDKVKLWGHRLED